MHKNFETFLIIFLNSFHIQFIKYILDNNYWKKIFTLFIIAVLHILLRLYRTSSSNQ